MKSYALCPISDKKINEKVARLNGAFTVLLLIVFAFTQSTIPMILLAFDFFLRSYNLSKFSLIAVSSKGIAKYFSLNESFINAGPKLFAARIGLVLSSLIIVLFLSGAIIPAFVLAGILGIFSFLEAAFGLCVACEIYPFIYRLLYKLNFQN